MNSLRFRSIGTDERLVDRVANEIERMIVERDAARRVFVVVQRRAGAAAHVA